jgi:flagellar biosynthetic protein FliQ
MNEGDVGTVLRECVLVVIKLGGPLLIAALVIGIIVALIQAVTQISEASLTFVPKLLVLSFSLMMLGPFMLRTLTTFANDLFDRMVVIGGS